MPLLDMSLEEMRDYKPPREEPEDFEAFWAGTLEEARAQDLKAVFEPVDSGLATLEVFDVTLPGALVDHITAW